MSVVFVNLEMLFYHIIPESDGGSPELYKDIHFERDKDYME